MWKTINGLGQPVTWYSEEEYQSIKKLNEANKGLLTATGKMNYQLLQEYDKLKNCLTEIKEILLFNKKELEECLHNDIDGQILQKISEVEQCNKNS